jgi:hypothetical protein
VCGVEVTNFTPAASDKSGATGPRKVAYGRALPDGGRSLASALAIMRSTTRWLPR